MTNFGNKIFVYGTLREGFNNAMEKVLHENSLYLGIGYMHGKLFDLGRYPAVTIGHDENSKVIGEVFEMNDADYLLPKLDEYEGIGMHYPQPHEYFRRQTKIFTDNDCYLCWVYAYNLDTDDIKLIESGDYLEYAKKTMQI